MRTLPQFRVNPTVLSGVLISYSALWFAAAVAFYLANKQSKDGWSAAPVAVMWVLFVLPLLALVLAASLVSLRRSNKQRLTVVDRLAIAGATVPFVFVGLLFLIMVLSR
jgi:hypothetical protein